MTVSDLAKVWNNFYSGTTELQFTYKGVDTPLYRLHKIYEEVSEFNVEIKPIKLSENSLTFYSTRYDLENLNEFDMELMDSLRITYPENTYKNILVVHIK